VYKLISYSRKTKRKKEKKKKSFPVYEIRNDSLRNFELRGKFLSRLNWVLLRCRCCGFSSWNFWGWPGCSLSLKLKSASRNLLQQFSASRTSHCIFRATKTQGIIFTSFSGKFLFSNAKRMLCRIFSLSKAPLSIDRQPLQQLIQRLESAGCSRLKMRKSIDIPT